MHDLNSRLQTILASWRANPGRAPGGTGSTGLASTDAQGYSDMLNEQREAAELQSGQPLTLRMGKVIQGLR